MGGLAGASPRTKVRIEFPYAEGVQGSLMLMPLLFLLLLLL